jgi:hypothetical protein
LLSNRLPGIFVDRPVCKTVLNQPLSRLMNIIGYPNVARVPDSMVEEFGLCEDGQTGPTHLGGVKL